MSTFLTPAEDKQLIDNGYEPIPIQGKAAVATAWQTGPITPDRMTALREVYPEARGTGLRTGRLAAIDIDVRDKAHTEAIVALADKVLGPTPLKRFGSKGLLLCYRNDEPIRKISILTDAAVPGEFADKVEVLGTGLQFAAFGIHPDTEKPYEWIGTTDFDEIATPLNTPVDTLPNVTKANCEEFSTECARLLAGAGYSNPRVRTAYEGDKAKRETDAEQDAPQNVTRAIQHLQNCVSKGHVAVIGALGNDTIYDLACCLLDRFYLSQDTVERLMLEHWYPHCIPNTMEDECRLIISHAASYMQNEPGARALPPVVDTFAGAIAALVGKDGPGEATNSDMGQAQQIILQDENHDEDDGPIDAAEYIGMEFPPLRELVPTWCERNTNTFLEGPAATQKSRAALQDAISLNAGLPVMGKEGIEQCETIYLNYENSPEEMARRVHLICKFLQGNNKSEPVNPRGVHIWELRKNPRPIITVSRDKGVLITRFGRRFLSLIATRRNYGKHTLVVFDGLMDAIIFHDNTRNDDTVAMSLIRLIDSWCIEYDFSAYSIVHPSRSSERGNSVGSYATAWTTKPRAIQTFKRVLSPFAGGGPKAKITEDTPIDDIFYQRRVQKRSNGPEGDRMLLEYWKGGLRPHYPPKKNRPQAEIPNEENSPQPDLEDVAF